MARAGQSEALRPIQTVAERQSEATLAETIDIQERSGGPFD